MSQVVAGYYENFESEFLSELVCEKEYQAAHLLVKRMIDRTKDSYWRAFANADDILAQKTAAILHANASRIAAFMKNKTLEIHHFQEFLKVFPGYDIEQLKKFAKFKCD